MANFSHRTARFKYVQLSTYHTHTVCIFCPHFLTTLLKGQCKFSLALLATVFCLPNMNLVLYTGLLGGYLDPQGIEVVPHQDRPVKGFVQVSDCTKAHCVYLVSPKQICLFTLASTEAISTLQRGGGEAGRLPPPLNNHLSTIC